MTAPLSFQRIGTTNLFIADDGEGRSRTSIIRSNPNAAATVYRVPSASILVIGDQTIDALKTLFTQTGYPSLATIWPNGLSSSTYTKLRRWLNVAERGEHGMRMH